MGEIYKLSGQYVTKPSSFATSGEPGCSAEFSEQLALTHSTTQRLTLDDDATLNVDLGGVTNVAVLHIRSDRKVLVNVTSADGAAQAVPVDGHLMIISESVPITAIALTRVAGIDTQVTLFMGEL